MQKLRLRLTFANVTSVLALFVALGGSAYAAAQLKKNSVGTTQLKKNAVTGAKVKDQSLTGKDIKLSKLGTVPAASHANTADTASALSPAEPIHIVGAPGEPPFTNGSENAPTPSGSKLQPVSFYKDHDGVVHLEGVVHVGKGALINAVSIFSLPPGFRPAPGTLLALEAGETGILIAGTEAPIEGVTFNGSVLAKEGASLPLGGITFRAQG